MTSFTPDWDIFCRVIDNYGDIGVSWRLARILAQDHAQSVRLWVDDLVALTTLVPPIDPSKEQQIVENVTVLHWRNNTPTIRPAHFVVEAFGCTLPDEYLKQMPGHTSAWFNLEYFSAEPWISDYHGLFSPQPNGLQKQFVFPSTRPQSGGLLRETQLLQDHALFTPVDQASWAETWHIPLPQGLTLLLFGYENHALGALIEQIEQNTNDTVTLYLPHGRLLNSARNHFGRPDLKAGDTIEHGLIRLHVLPFLPQAQFDRLLWLCDILFVRGEDSLVRALWAGKPFIWQIYPTDDQAHWKKLDALLDTCRAELPPAAFDASFDAWRTFTHDWNRQHLTPQSWQNLVAYLGDLTKAAGANRTMLSAQNELSAWLVKTAHERLQCHII